MDASRSPPNSIECHRAAEIGHTKGTDRGGRERRRGQKYPLTCTNDSAALVGHGNRCDRGRRAGPGNGFRGIWERACSGDTYREDTDTEVIDARHECTFLLSVPGEARPNDLTAKRDNGSVRRGHGANRCESVQQCPL